MARMRRVGVAAGLAATYFVVGRFGLTLDAESGFASLVWPPTGVALAALVLLGVRYWPALWVGAFLVNASLGMPAGAAVVVASGNTAEAVIGATLLRAAGFHAAIDRVRDAVALGVGGALPGAVVAATAGVAMLRRTGFAAPGTFWSTWRAWFLGDLLGVLIVAPLLLVWCTPPRPRLSRGKWLEALAALCTVGATGLFVFASQQLAEAIPFQRSYLIFPVLIWIVLRFGQHGAVTALAGLSAVSVTCTVLGLGPFAQTPVPEGLLFAQGFMAITATTALVLGAAVRERQHLLESHEEMLAVVSHDLRTPLSAVRTTVELLRRAPGGMEKRLDAIDRATQRMDHLINDLLELGAIERGKLRVEPVVFQAGPFFDELVRDLSVVGTRKQQRVELVPPPAGLELLADRDRVAQVTTNLVSNALAHAASGTTVTVACVQREAFCEVTVADTGPGLDEESLPHLFEPYWKGNPRAQGVGLGLSIARGLVEAHGGRIWAENAKRGSGAVFHFTIPVALRSSRASSARTRLRLPSKP